MMNALYSARLFANSPMHGGFRQHRGQHHYSVIVPNRIYVGDLKDDIGCSELIQIFSSHGRVKTVNIVTNAEGVSKGYGFVTFENANDAKKVQALRKIVLIGNRKLTIASAFRKCQYCKSYISQSRSAVKYARAGAQYVAEPRSGVQSVAQTRSALNLIDLSNMPVGSYIGEGGNAGQLDSNAYLSASPTAGEFRVFNVTMSASDSMFSPIENMPATVQVEQPVLSNPYIMATAGIIRGFGYESRFLVLQAL